MRRPCIGSHPTLPERWICEMHTAYGHPDPDMPMWALRSLRSRLILEECAEAADALMGRDNWRARDAEPPANGPMNVQHVAKELADILVVTYGAADALGIPMHRVLRRVHVSNMSKVQPDGSVLRRDDGKILKGPNYVPPDLSFLPGLVDA